MVNLTMIREIFRSMMEVELSDTDLLVIPLKNRYKKNELRYSCLTGTDQLMAGLLRYVRNFEIRLAFVTYYRDGYAIDESEEERESRDDDGYSESELEYPEDKPKKRFIEEIRVEQYSIEKIYKLNGSAKSVSSIPPIDWEADYIHRNISDIDEIFDEESAGALAIPDKEEYNRFLGPEPLLKQWFYKPILVLWPKDSFIIDCRINFIGTLTRLTQAASETKWSVENEKERQAKLLELKKIIYYFDYQLLIHPDDEFFDEEEERMNANILIHLLKLCNALQAAHEGLYLCNSFCSSPHLDWFDDQLLKAMAEFISFTGWNFCKEFIFSLFDTISSSDEQWTAVNLFLIQLVKNLLTRDEPLSNEAAAKIYHWIFREIFPPSIYQTISTETFRNEISSAIFNKNVFFHNILILEHRKLLNRNPNLVTLSTSYLTKMPVTELYSFLKILSLSTLVINFHLAQLTSQCRKLFDLLCRRIVKFDLHHQESKSDICLIYSIFKLCTFIQNESILQALITKICTIQLKKLQDNILLKTILTLDSFQQEPTFQHLFKNLKTDLMERLRKYRHLLKTELKSTETDALSSDFKNQVEYSIKFYNTIDYYIRNLPLEESLSE